MLCIDGHLDLAYNAVDLGRDLTRPVDDIRRAEGPCPAHGEGVATVSLPALRAGGLRIVLATLYASPAGRQRPAPLPACATPEEAWRLADAQLACYERWEQAGEATLLRTRRALDAAAAGAGPLPALALGMEGADPLRTPADLAAFAARGVRLVGLAWKTTRYAAGTGVPGMPGGGGTRGALTAAGRELLAEMDRLGVALDVSHLAEEAFWQALAIFKGRVVASHANCRALVPGDRHLSDDMARAIADRDGVVGLVCYNRFIVPGWERAQGRAAVSLADLLPHVARLAAVAGPRHIGLGSDLDGGIGRDDIPRELDTAADLPRFAGVLAGAGYAEHEIAAIMGGNWLRLLHTLMRD